MNLPIEFTCFDCEEAKRRLRIILPRTNAFERFPNVYVNQHLTYEQARLLYPWWIPDECFLFPGVESFKDHTQASEHAFVIPSSPHGTCLGNFVGTFYPISDRALNSITDTENEMIFLQSDSKLPSIESAEYADLIESRSYATMIPFLRRVIAGQTFEHLELIVLMKEGASKFDRMCLFNIPDGPKPKNNRYSKELFVNEPSLLTNDSNHVLFVGRRPGYRYQFFDFFRRVSPIDDVVVSTNIGGKRKRVNTKTTNESRKTIDLVECNSMFTAGYPENLLQVQVRKTSDEKFRAKMQLRFKQYWFLHRIRSSFFEEFGEQANFEEEMRKITYDFVNRLSPKDY